MEYAFFGLLVPAKDNYDANAIINQLTNAVEKSQCDLRKADYIVGCPEIENLGEFTLDLEQFLLKYVRAIYRKKENVYVQNN